MEHYNFFISYSINSNIMLLEILIKKLETLGFSVWYDKFNVIMGNNIYSGIENILGEARKWDGAILFLDKSYFKKDWCNYELEYFIKNDFSLFPILNSMNKEDIVDKYSILKDLNLCRVNNENDIKYCVNKIIWKYLSVFDLDIKEHFFISENNALLNQLIYDYKNCIYIDYNKIFVCDSIALCIQYLLVQNNLELPNDIKILLNIIHAYKKEYLLSGYINLFEIKIIIKCTEIILNTYNL